MTAILSWTLFAYLSGGLPFSVWLGRVFLKTDIRAIGDGNPGATNVFRAGSRSLGTLAVILDMGKGFLPVYLAQANGLRAWDLLPVALAPALGHSLSPFLRFRGGKALAATGGSWLALIGPVVFPVYAALTVPVLLLVREHAWAASAGMLALMLFTLQIAGANWLSALAALNTLLIWWTHRRELRQPPHLRAWVSSFHLPRRT